MTTDDLLTFYPSQASACRAVNVVRQSFPVWRKKGRVPDRAQLVFLFVSGGNLVPSQDVLDLYCINEEMLGDIREAAAKRYPLTPAIIDGRNCA